MHKVHAAKPLHSVAGVKAKVYFGRPRPCTVRITVIFINREGSRTAVPPSRQFFVQQRMCKKKAAETRVQTIVLCMCRTLQSVLIRGWVCFESCTDVTVQETERKVKYTGALRFLITWREWEMSFQCELFGSRVWLNLPHQHERQKWHEYGGNYGGWDGGFDFQEI